MKACFRKSEKQIHNPFFLNPTGRQYPFRLGVKFNDNEEISGTAPNTNDKALVPSGILGFKLEWYQGSC